MSVKRVTLALDATLRDQATLRVATRIAAQLDAELTALFVTSGHLQRFAGLPTATEVLIGSARSRRADPGALAADLERLMGNTTEQLGDLAREMDVACSIVRTSLEAVPESPPTDLLLVDRRAGHSPVSRAELGSLAARLVSHCQKSILVFERELSPDKPVSLLTASLTGPALEMALDFARSPGRLFALIDAPDHRSFELHDERLRKTLVAHSVVLHTEWVREPRPHLLASTLLGHDSGILIVDAANTLVQREDLASLLETLRIPVLLTR